MGTIRTISIGMRADASLLIDEVDRTTKAFDRFSDAADRTSRAAADLSLAPGKSVSAEVGTPGAGTAAAAGAGIRDIAATASLMGQAFQAALSPVAGVFGKVEAEVNRTGGTIVTLARRIDSLFKMPGLEDARARLMEAFAFKDLIAATDRLAARIRIPLLKVFGELSGWVYDMGTTFDMVMQSIIVTVAASATTIAAVMGRAIGLVLQGYTRLLAASWRFSVGAVFAIGNVATKFLWAGDIARKSLTSLFKITFTGPIVAVQKLTTSLFNVVPGANAASRSVRSFGSQLLVAFGLFGAGYKVAEFFKNGVKEASNLNETINKTNVIFGKSSGVVANAADEMAARYGTVKTSFMDTADTIGNLLKGMGGQSEKTAATMGATLAKAAADVSSIANISFEEAAGKIASALRGQSEPISSLGVDMQDAAVKAEALRMGLFKGSGEMTTQQKVAARTSLIIKGLAFANGDLANTIEDPANAMRRFQGNVTNLGASIGTTMLPALKRGIGLLNDFATWLSKAFEDNKDVFTSFAERVGSTIDYAGAVFRHLPAAWEIVKLKLAEGVLNVVALFEVLPANLKIIGEWIANNWSQLIVDGINVAINAFQNLGTNIENLWKAIQDFAAGKGFHFEATPLLKGFKATVAELPELIKPEFVDMSDRINEQIAIFDNDLAERAAKRKAMMAAAKPRAAVPAPLGEPATTTGVRTGPAFAGALEVGTKEAYSAQLKFSVGGQEDAVKGIKKNTGDQVVILGRIETALNRMAGKAPDAPGLPAAPF